MRSPGRKNGHKRLLGIILVLGLLTVGTYAFTNSNTFAAGVPAAGDSGNTGAISGYVISNVNYVLDLASQTTITSYTFNLDGAAAYVKGSLNGGSTWDACTAAASSPYLVTCTPVTPVSTASATNLRVVAYNDTPANL